MPLYGSSRTTGGILRGRALGNAPNYADYPDIGSAGRVLVYVSKANPAEVDPGTTRVTTTIRHPTTKTIGPVIRELHRRFTPIQTECIYVLEGDLWGVKGRYNDALEMDDEVDWIWEGEYLCSPITCGNVSEFNLYVLLIVG
ncbi:hypothetical protein BD779DRAFT_1438654 [Infundibulicybe gibba]|nr:hypothetical protein BD779DRAFT_1438654 [Infundibulicybe gibba]